MKKYKVVDTNGNPVPAGTYETANNKYIEVDDDGMTDKIHFEHISNPNNWHGPIAPKVEEERTQGGRRDQAKGLEPDTKVWEITAAFLVGLAFSFGILFIISFIYSLFK